MNYIDTSTKAVHSEQAIRSANPNTSFPAPFIPPVGYELVFDAPHPAHDPITQTVKEWPPVLTNKGHYEQAWEVVSLSPAQVLVNQATQRKAQVDAFDVALTTHLDSTAQQRRYDNRITCMVRAGFAGPFQAEGQAFATWCDNCNILAYHLLAAVEAGTAPLPASPEAFIATLPAMVWPV